MATKKPYSELSDLEKLQKQWHKLSGLHTREEWSAAIVRAATAAEIAANFAVRKEFGARSELDAEFINHLLRWANGLAGKLDRLLVPLSSVGWADAGSPTSFTPGIPEHKGCRLQPARRSAFCACRLGGMQNAQAS